MPVITLLYFQIILKQLINTLIVITFIKKKIKALKHFKATLYAICRYNLEKIQITYFNNKGTLQ